MNWDKADSLNEIKWCILCCVVLWGHTILICINWLNLWATYIGTSFYCKVTKRTQLIDAKSICYYEDDDVQPFQFVSSCVITPVFSHVYFDHALGKPPCESQHSKGIPTWVCRQLLKNCPASDSKIATRLPCTALKPPPATKEATCGKCTAVILNPPNHQPHPWKGTLRDSLTPDQDVKFNWPCNWFVLSPNGKTKHVYHVTLQ